MVMNDGSYNGNNRNANSGNNNYTPRKQSAGQNFGSNKNANYSPSTSYNYNNQGSSTTRDRGGYQNNLRKKNDRFTKNTPNSNDKLLKQNDIIIKLLREIRDRLPALKQTSSPVENREKNKNFKNSHSASGTKRAYKENNMPKKLEIAKTASEEKKADGSVTPQVLKTDSKEGNLADIVSDLITDGNISGKKAEEKKVEDKKVEDKNVVDKVVEEKIVEDENVEDKNVVDKKVDDEKVVDKKVEVKKVVDKKVVDKKIEEKKPEEKKDVEIVKES